MRTRWLTSNGAVSLANRVLFRPVLRLTAALIVIGAAGPVQADVQAADLRADTLGAFDRYVRATEMRMDREVTGLVPFLWIDRLAGADRRDALTRLQHGETLVTAISTSDLKGRMDAPHGLVHHWSGTVLIPDVTVDRVVSLMQDYSRYQEIYSPNIRQSRTVSRQGDTFKVYLQLFMKKVIGVVLNTEYDVRYKRLSPTRVNVRSYSTRIAELRDAGTANEKEAAVGDDSGFLWRFNNYCSLDGRVEGTYVECESVSLSRAIPIGLGWIVGPFVTSIPRESLEFTLGRMRKALS
jgi:hypothetical protein